MMMTAAFLVGQSSGLANSRRIDWFKSVTLGRPQITMPRIEQLAKSDELLAFAATEQRIALLGAPSKKVLEFSGVDIVRSSEQAFLGVPILSKELEMHAETIAAGRYIGAKTPFLMFRKDGGFAPPRLGSVYLSFSTDINDLYYKKSKSVNKWQQPPSEVLRALSTQAPPRMIALDHLEKDKPPREKKENIGHLISRIALNGKAKDLGLVNFPHLGYFYQSAYANSGAWNHLENMMAGVAATKDYMTIDNVGPIWASSAKSESGYSGVLEARDLIPEAYFRASLILPLRDKAGRSLTLAEALHLARPIGAIVGNNLVENEKNAFWENHSVSIEEIERRTGIEFFPFLNRLPNGSELVHILKTHVDKGVGLPDEMRYIREKRVVRPVYSAGRRKVSPLRGNSAPRKRQSAKFGRGRH